LLSFEFRQTHGVGRSLDLILGGIQQGMVTNEISCIFSILKIPKFSNYQLTSGVRSAHKNRLKTCFIIFSGLKTNIFYFKRRIS